MELSAQQIEAFHREGYLFLPELFTPEEVAVLRDEAEGIYAADRPEVWREKSGAPRTAFAAHLYNEAFGLLGRHPRMIRPIEQIFGEKLYEIYYRFLETEDEYFDYAPAPIPPQGRWRIYGLGLPETILRKVYYENAAPLLRI